MKHVFVAVIIPLMLVACGQKTIKERLHEPKTALVIIGFSGNISWHTLWGNDYHIRSYNFPENKSQDVVLMPVTVGTRFRLTDIEHKSKKLSTAFKFSRAPTIRINRKGVYYYGIVETRSFGSKNVESRVNTRVDDGVIALAKNKYPDVFNKYDNIIFRSEELGPINGKGRGGYLP